MNIVELSEAISDVESTIKYLRNKNLLRKSYDHCGQQCYELYHKSTSDNLTFRCKVCRKKFSIRQDSIFSKSRLKLQNLLVLVYAFANGFSVTDAKKLLHDVVSERSIIQWYSYLREVCSEALLNTPIQLGGNGSIVEIDEAVLGAKRKYNRGYNRGITQWVFGLIDITSKKCVLRLVPNRQAQTLVPIITQNCVPNCTIHSDEAAMYTGLSGHGFTHRTVCHKDNFVAPNGVHTNTIEGFWGHLKAHFKAMNGTNRDMLPLHVDEFMYRHNNKGNGNLYDIFVQDIARYYPV